MEDRVFRESSPLFASLDFVKSLPAFDSSPFLGDGLSLRAVIELVQARQTNHQSYWQGMEQALEEALTLQDKLPLSSSLFRGLPGIGWAVQLCPLLLDKTSSQQFLVELDEILLDGILETHHPNLDMVNGIAGIMVYAMRRGLSASSSSDLWSAIELVCSRAVREWLNFSDASDLESRGTDFQKNLGLAHGIPGLLLMMANASRKGHISRAATELALDGFDHLWMHAIKGDDDGVLFPSTAGSQRVTRLAWCYGGLGLADAYRRASLLDSSYGVRFSSLIEGSLNQFKSGKHQITDASLCHGAAGVHLYFEIFGRCEFLSAQLRNECKKASVVAGEKLLHFNDGTVEKPSYLWSHKGKNIKTASLLEGTTGVVLAQNAVASQSNCYPWAELLGLHQIDNE
ncbi:lanthionine synthetase LanC family protein [Xanthomonas fragariae]|uniref:lanthionine synthetase LanC family protein n=1 Tax=Xanthomonas fragariae TaxID=48664 RepID=UPI001ABEBB7B|nr:lanthionine synthetase LanC family protein [Xanthomonas fragariae]UKR53725.1 hypothetical protein K4A87_07655 [Xanthomonas fragariae]